MNDYIGCPWPIDPGCLDSEWDGYDEGLQERAISLASNALHMLTGYRVGGCPITVRPVIETGSCWGPRDLPFWRSHGVNSGHYGSLLISSRPPTYTSVTLPGPVGRLDEVKIDGVAQDLTDYRVDGSLLVYTAGSPAPWPLTQDVDLNDSEPGTFSVTYLNSYPVDGNGAYAAGALADQFAKACAGSSKCKLPKSVTTIVRQGVTMNLAEGVFPKGLTGIREVDAYIRLWRPENGPSRAPAMWSPDMPGTRVQGGPL